MSAAAGNSSTNTCKIGLAGCGKMGSAMVRGWLDAGIISTIDILDPHGIPDELLHNKNVAYFKTESDFAKNAAKWDALVIAVKPQTLNDFCTAFGPLPPQTPVLSIAAGQTIRTFESKFGQDRPVIRAMPNTPAAIGKGVTVAAVNTHVNHAQKQMTENLLRTLGLFAWVDDEEKLDAVTGLSGSGPAYVFYFIEAMAKAGEAAGLPADLAMTLARQTVIGAGALADNDAQTPASKLRENVTSPNGTTAAGLELLMNGDFQDIVTKTIARATARSKELSS